MSLDYPEVSVQASIGAETWWTKDLSKALRPGRLVRAFIQHVGVPPYKLTAIGRASATDHKNVNYAVEALDIKGAREARRLPVAGLPSTGGQVWTVHGSKVRPAVVLSTPGQGVARELVASSASWLSEPTVLVAPYYGADQDGTRGGWPPRFVERIRRAEYPQYFWDKLPLNSVSESILRLDHVQPIARDKSAYEATEWVLSPDALAFIHEQLDWFLTGSMEADGLLACFRSELAKLPGGGT